MLVAELKRIAPIFPVRDLGVALAHYALLGFTTREYAGGGYGYAARGDVEIHLGTSANAAGPASAYLYVDDADDLAHSWRSTGVAVHMPVDTEWGQREGAVFDPDGNVIRFGSPLTKSSI